MSSPQWPRWSRRRMAIPRRKTPRRRLRSEGCPSCPLPSGSQIRPLSRSLGSDTCRSLRSGLVTRADDRTARGRVLTAFPATGLFVDESSVTTTVVPVEPSGAGLEAVTVDWAPRRQRSEGYRGGIGDHGVGGRVLCGERDRFVGRSVAVKVATPEASVASGCAGLTTALPVPVSVTVSSATGCGVTRLIAQGHGDGRRARGHGRPAVTLEWEASPRSLKHDDPPSVSRSQYRCCPWPAA